MAEQVAGPSAPRPTGPPVLERWIPGLGVARRYERAWLRHDIVAGLVLTALLVPAGMGYAQAAGLPPITGLYATIVPLLGYALLGPSRILVLGPDSSLAPLIAAAILPLALGDDVMAVALAGTLAILVGVLVAGTGLIRVGFVTDLLSNPVRHGYLAGIALTVIIGQLGKVFGFSLEGDNVLQEAVSLVKGIVEGLVNPVALVIGTACFLAILGFKAWRPRIPGVLVAVVGATIVSGLLDLETTADLSVVGALPQGLPSFALPPLDLGTVTALLPGAIGIALVAAADTSILSRTFARRVGDDVDPNRELIGLGGANVLGGLFTGFPVSSSSSRTPVAESAGSKSQLTGVVGAVAIAILLLVAPNLLAPLPSAALGAVVISAALSLVDAPAFAHLWRARRSEFVLAAASFAGVAMLGVINGIFIAIVLSLLAFLRRAWWPHDAILGRAQGVKGYHDLMYYPQARQVPGLVLYRFDAPLFFANADVFQGRVLERVAAASPPARWVIVAAEPITDIDTTASDMLVELHDELAGRNVVLAFAELKDFVRDRLQAYGAIERLGPLRVYPTLGTAVDAYVEATGQDWVDWEEALEVDAGAEPSGRPAEGADSAATGPP